MTQSIFYEPVVMVEGYAIMLIILLVEYKVCKVDVRLRELDRLAIWLCGEDMAAQFRAHEGGERPIS